MTIPRECCKVTKEHREHHTNIETTFKTLLESPLAYLTLYSRNISLHVPSHVLWDRKLLNTTLHTFQREKITWPGPGSYLHNVAELLHEGRHGADVEVVQAQGVAEGLAVLRQQLRQRQRVVLLCPQQLHQLGSHCLHLLHLCQREDLLLPALQDLHNTRDTLLRSLVQSGWTKQLKLRACRQAFAVYQDPATSKTVFTASKTI